MKKIHKDFLKDVGNGIGYAAAMGVVSIVEWILYKIHKNGYFHGIEPNRKILNTELVVVGSIIPFLGYRLIKSLRK